MEPKFTEPGRRRGDVDATGGMVAIGEMAFLTGRVVEVTYRAMTDAEAEAAWIPARSTGRWIR